MNKVNKMKKFDRDSVEFMRASLEIQEMVKSDLDLRVYNATEAMKEKVKFAEE